MTHESLLDGLWQSSLARLGGEAAIEASARKSGAFLRARAVGSASDLLRLILAYCLGGMGLRLTSAWAASASLADLSNVALLKRLRQCGGWMEHLAGTLLSDGQKPAAEGRRIRLLDGTTIPKGVLVPVAGFTSKSCFPKAVRSPVRSANVGTVVTTPEPMRCRCP